MQAFNAIITTMPTKLGQLSYWLNLHRKITDNAEIQDRNLTLSILNASGLGEGTQSLVSFTVML